MLVLENCLSKRVFIAKSSIEKKSLFGKFVKYLRFSSCKKKVHNFYSITAAIIALFMHEIINERDISDETRFNFYDTRSIDLHRRMAMGQCFYLSLFFRKKVGHFDLNDATPQHPF